MLILRDGTPRVIMRRGGDDGGGDDGGSGDVAYP